MRVTHLLTPAIYLFLFSSSAFAQPLTSRIYQIMGIKDPNRSLVAIDNRAVCVFVSINTLNPSQYSLNPTEIRSITKGILSEAGFRVLDRIAVSNENFELWINIGILRIESCGQCVVNIETSVSIDVQLQNMEELFHFPADVWKVESGLRAVSINEVKSEVNDIVQEQVNIFINACQKTFSIEKQTDVNQPKPQLRKVTVEKDTKPAKQQAVEAAFVASKNSQVFHKASCPSAKRISPHNLVSYATRDEAIAAGKKPCERCNP